MALQGWDMDMSPSRARPPPAVRRPHDSATSMRRRGSEAVAWLMERGVAAAHAAAFRHRSGCDTVSDVALFLRFQLPPLEYANADCIHNDMLELLGVPPSTAQRIVSDLDIMRAPPPFHMRPPDPPNP